LAIKAEKPRPATAISSAEVAVTPKIEAFKQSRSVSASAAATQLAALNEKGSSRNLKSRLRRAFSFSGSTELRKASAENNLAAERAKMRKDAEQAEEDATVAATQEANGLGSNIYSGQAEFIASTDNISISSTASSASIMLRKFGRGMKKSTRNLRSLFRPKSMIVTGSEGLEETLAAEVSLVTVEAERLKVNVNLDPHDKPGGGTGYPKLERNSMEVPDGMAPDFESPRKSIIGGDRERAEVLAAVRKGILKRTFPRPSPDQTDHPRLRPALGRLLTIHRPGRTPRPGRDLLRRREQQLAPLARRRPALVGQRRRDQRRVLWRHQREPGGQHAQPADGGDAQRLVRHARAVLRIVEQLRVRPARRRGDVQLPHAAPGPADQGGAEYVQDGENIRLD
jgi:hypothetical protein